ncbi:putative Type 1 protein phosphatase inhibitor [Helianthus annuus]|uniref:Type 1 protein phosphatase inhibitor n=1 Tax=Helianthus annuus TaxID=4232 RepID=A0A251T7H4_HELAN|nr:protein phosphatase 1 regulatory subunit INH3 [Helianthus annuus]KAF5770573.1 putative Type 1 protein phosphatase inhibitor [Helianthus annuus]KAJ0465464.1 putative Type 1 protein phosphatase inhibitor [Helianthus annuus]KAJ0470294.1 putative Type 1 protein phosphatase inhibitor [Helianthus annuus]KAJ0487061.1 putative Type 1 protein phosphatase inhibitor [Helianthus annuus]KAJ0661184.1 putative Type 1 protein phosphatase inhibitor [Helianthus annuus]
MTRHARQSSSTTTTTTTTITLENPVPSQTTTLTITLNPRKKKVTWKEGTVDNEFLQKKSSRKCCIFHKQKPFDEDSSDDEDCHDLVADSRRMTEHPRVRMFSCFCVVFSGFKSDELGMLLGF